MDTASVNRTFLLVANFSGKSSILAATSTMADSFDINNSTNVSNSNPPIDPSPSTHKIDWTDLVLALLLCVLIVVGGVEIVQNTHTHT